MSIISPHYDDLGEFISYLKNLSEHDRNCIISVDSENEFLSNVVYYFATFGNKNEDRLAESFIKEYSPINIKTVITTERQSKRDDKSSKPLPNQIPAYVRLRYGYRARLGANHYGKDNYLKGFPKEETRESLHRHLALYELGDRDEDHLSAIMFNLIQMFLDEEREGVLIDSFTGLSR